MSKCVKKTITNHNNKMASLESNLIILISVKKQLFSFQEQPQLHLSQRHDACGYLWIIRSRYLYIFNCVYTYIYIYIYSCSYRYLCIYVFIYLFMYLYKSISISTSIYIYMFIPVFIYLLLVYLSIYLFISKPSTGPVMKRWHLGELLK